MRNKDNRSKLNVFGRMLCKNKANKAMDFLIYLSRHARQFPLC